MPGAALVKAAVAPPAIGHHFDVRVRRVIRVEEVDDAPCKARRYQAEHGAR